jgi:hypothetical protein
VWFSIFFENPVCWLQYAQLALPDQPRHGELRVGVQGDPCPDIAAMLVKVNIITDQ